MNSVVEAKIKDYLILNLKYKSNQVGPILDKIDEAAAMAGFDVDERCAAAGLGAGPEARIASRIVDVSLLGGGSETPEYAMKKEIDDWLRRSKGKGR